MGLSGNSTGAIGEWETGSENAALWRIAVVRMRYHQLTKDYVARRTAEGKRKERSSAA